MRIRWVDIAKGFGLWLVIIGHLFTGGSPSFSWIFSFHMPLFFFLAGFVFRDARETGLRSSLVDIFTSLLVPYFLFVLLGLCVSALIPGWMPGSLKATITEVFWLVQPESAHVGQVWFLFCLAIVEVLFVLVRKAAIRRSWVEWMVISAIACFSLLVNEFVVRIIIKGVELRVPLKLDTASMALVFFYAGFVIRRSEHLLNRKPRFLILSLCMVASLVANVIFGPLLNGTVNMAANVYHNPLFFLISSFAGISFVLTLSRLIQKAAWIEFYGRNSLSLFSMHSFYLYGFAFALSAILGHQVTIMDNIPDWLCFVGLVAIALLIIPVPFLYRKTFGSIVSAAKRRVQVSS